MNSCINCNKTTENPKFCSLTCSAKYNSNFKPNKLPDGQCSGCNKPIRSKLTYCKTCFNTKTEKALCSVCGTSFNRPVGRKRRINSFCSIPCSALYRNRNHQSYECQKKRGLARQIELINLLGGKCLACGYKNNIAALAFHHIDPKTKTMSLDMRTCSNNSFEILLAEAKKCQLLCHNCHNEHHHPHLSGLL